MTASWRPSAQGDFRPIGTIPVTFDDDVDVGVAVLNFAQNTSRPRNFSARFDNLVLRC